MAANNVRELPEGDDWLYEVKLDGYRALVMKNAARVQIRSRNNKDLTHAYPAVAACGSRLAAASAVVDGEIVALDGNGHPSFQALQNRGSYPHHTIVFYAFDLLHLDGNDLTRLALQDRRRFLGDVVEPGAAWRCSPVYDDGAALLAAATDQGLEGVMAKRPESVYEPGKRSRSWLKVKVRRRQELVVGGWLPGEGGRAGRIGALLVGVHDPAGGPLRYAGRVGTGFTAAELDRLAGLLGPLETDTPPFDPPPPRPVMRTAHWVRPEHVAEIAFGEWTTDGVLRHPSYLGLRFDKDPAEVVREPG
jgi:bifunctional non-homologous end joining protein LigD